MPAVRVYTRNNCPYCDRAKNLLRQKGIAFEEINLSGREAELNALKARTGMMTVPQIFIGEELIGGYMELADLEAQGDLDTKIKHFAPSPTI